MMLNKIDNKHSVIKGISLLFLILVSLGQFLFAQQKFNEEKHIESFIAEITKTDTISDSFIHKYIIFDKKKDNISKIKQSLKELRTKYLTSKEKYAKPIISELDFISEQYSSKYYSIQLDSDRSLNFALESGKISSISLFQTSNYDTLVFF